MMHQNELPQTNSRNIYSASHESGDFYNQWDGGGAGGAHNRDEARGSHSGRGPKNYRRSDERILDDVHRALTEDDMLDASEIEVSVADGEVTLSGTVESKKDKRHAEVLLDSISGVSDVHNKLKVSSAASPVALKSIDGL